MVNPDTILLPLSITYGQQKNKGVFFFTHFLLGYAKFPGFSPPREK